MYLGPAAARENSLHIEFRYKRTHTRARCFVGRSREREKRESGGESGRTTQQNGVRVASFFRRRRRKKKNIISSAPRGKYARGTRTRSYDRIGRENIGEDQNDEEEIRRDRSGWCDVRRRLVVFCFFFFFSREIKSSAW